METEFTVSIDLTLTHYPPEREAGMPYWHWETDGWEPTGMEYRPYEGSPEDFTREDHPWVWDTLVAYLEDNWIPEEDGKGPIVWSPDDLQLDEEDYR